MPQHRAPAKLAHDARAYVQYGSIAGILLIAAIGTLVLLFTPGAHASTSRLSQPQPQRPPMAAVHALPGRAAGMSHPIAHAHAHAHTAVTAVTHVVARGDTLTGISGRFYRATRCWPGIYRANSRVIGKDPNEIRVGERLVISPACDARPLAGIITTAAVRPAAAAQPAAYGSPQAAAQAVFGSQYGCAAWVITRESGWNVFARNPSSGAYGIPQALPGSKMASAGADWATDPVTQLRWMRSYVDAAYGGACGAESFWAGHGYY